MSNFDLHCDEGTALLLDKLKGITDDANEARRRELDAIKAPLPPTMFPDEYADHRTEADRQYALAYRCEQLIEEINATGLFDRLDAEDEALRVATEHSRNDITEAASPEEATGFALGDTVNVSNSEHDHFGARGTVTALFSDGRVTVKFNDDGDIATLRAASLMPYTMFIAQSQDWFDMSEAAHVKYLAGMTTSVPGANNETIDAGEEWRLAERKHQNWVAAEPEHFDAAEAEDVARIKHEMDVEAGAECDPETCVYCGGA